MSVSQPEFRAALLDPDAPVPAGLLDGADQPAGKRFDVYRNNVVASLTEAIQAGFPVITKLLGQQNMDGLAGMFLRAHLPATPLMMKYGEMFPEFLAALPQLQHLGYLPDVARLELALRASYHAADAEAVDPADLGRIAPDRLMHCTVGLAPAVRVLRSDWPIFDIWRFNSEGDAPKPRAEPQDVLITRPEFDPVPHLLAQGGAACLLALQAGRTLESAIDTGQSEAPSFDIGALLPLLLQGNALTSPTMKD